jgi:hypothetical protein
VCSMRNALIRAPDVARFAIELYKHPFLTYLDLSMDFPRYSTDGDKTGELKVSDRGALGYQRNYTGIGLEGMESLSVWLTATRVLKKLRHVRCFVLNEPHKLLRLRYLQFTRLPCSRRRGDRPSALFSDKCLLVRVSAVH